MSCCFNGTPLPQDSERENAGHVRLRPSRASECFQRDRRFWEHGRNAGRRALDKPSDPMPFVPVSSSFLPIPPLERSTCYPMPYGALQEVPHIPKISNLGSTQPQSEPLNPSNPSRSESLDFEQQDPNPELFKHPMSLAAWQSSRKSIQRET